MMVKSRTAWLVVALVFTIGALVIIPFVMLFTQDPLRLERLYKDARRRAQQATGDMDATNGNATMTESGEDNSGERDSSFTSNGKCVILRGSV